MSDIHFVFVENGKVVFESTEVFDRFLKQICKEAKEEEHDKAYKEGYEDGYDRGYECGKKSNSLTGYPSNIPMPSTPSPLTPTTPWTTPSVIYCDTNITTKDSNYSNTTTTAQN